MTIIFDVNNIATSDTLRVKEGLGYGISRNPHRWPGLSKTGTSKRWENRKEWGIVTLTLSNIHSNVIVSNFESENDAGQERSDFILQLKHHLLLR